MKKSTKTLLISLCAVLLVAVSVMGTLAYLTSTAEVKNTFSIGSVTITMDETDVTVYGVKDTDTRVTANSYKLMPGHEYIKDPIVHVAANSEACYVFVKVENGISAIESTAEGYTNIASQITTTNGWAALGVVDNVYYKTQDATTAAVDLKVFEEFAINSAVLGGEKPATPAEGALYLSDYNNATITVTAYAIQSDGFDTAAAAWAASGWGTTTTD